MFQAIRKQFFCWIGPVVFGLIVLNQFRLYEQAWEFGRYGMPHSLVAADGQHYANGTKIDPIIQEVIAADCEEEVFLAILALVFVLGFLLLLELRHRRKLLIQFEAMFGRSQEDGR